MPECFELSYEASGLAFGVATVLGPDARFNFATVNDNNNSVAVYALPQDE